MTKQEKHKTDEWTWSANTEKDFYAEQKHTRKAIEQVRKCVCRLKPKEMSVLIVK